MRGSRSDERRELALAQVVADRLARHGCVAEHAQEVVTHLEGLAERQPDGTQRRRELLVTPGERGAEMQRTLDGVLARLVALDARRLPGIAAPAGGTHQVEVLTDAQLDPQLVEHLPCRGRCIAEQPIGVDEGEVADEDRRPFPEAPRLAAPTGLTVLHAEALVDRRQATAQPGAVHHVVVHERERVQELERGAGVDHERIVGRSARAHVRPMTERGAQPLAARPNEVAQRRERLDEVFVDRRPALDLGLEQLDHARFGARTHFCEARRYHAGPASRRGHRLIVGARYHRRGGGVPVGSVDRRARRGGRGRAARGR